MRHKDEYRFAEKCMYEYPANCAKLEALIAEVNLMRRSSDVHGHSYNVRNNVQGGKADPVSAYVEKLCAMEHAVMRLKRYIEPVRRLMSDLTGSNVFAGSRNKYYSQILKLYYFGGNSAQSVIAELHMSRTMFYERKKQLVQKAVEYLGLT